MTNTMSLKEALPILTAIADGAEWEYRRPDELKWTYSEEWGLGPISALNNYCEIRIRPELITEKFHSLKYIPLGPEDVPPGTVLRGAGELEDEGWCMITSCSLTGIRLWRHSHCDPDETTWRTLRENQSEILRPGATAWEPCKKLKV